MPVRFPGTSSFWFRLTLPSLCLITLVPLADSGVLNTADGLRNRTTFLLIVDGTFLGGFVPTLLGRFIPTLLLRNSIVNDFALLFLVR